MKDFLDGVTEPDSIRARHFVRHVERGIAEVGGAITWHCDHWVGEMSRGDTRKFVIGYSFPLNAVSSARVADDKVATTTILRENKVPCVEHRLVRPAWSGTEQIGWQAELPVVVKPNVESGGRDVHLVHTLDELDRTISELAERHRALAWSPFLEIGDEYRTVFLDDELLLAFRKVRADNGEWRHNLHFGATPEVCADPSTVDLLTDLGRDTMAALTLRFATVDIVTTPNGPLVLEVNSGVSLERFSRHSPEYTDLAGQVYARAVAAALR
ncbi:ATP-grasp domain-containing protein [Actinokineospora enzanensis]|uniref:ATP-grasp domain-containing protein n=1 Tax=Actinokineospora enzanensis TaxID=155975 RepID=UPI000382A4C9|nr:hypothetical protein [Actinokineospora enzanensis]